VVNGLKRAEGGEAFDRATDFRPIRRWTRPRASGGPGLGRPQPARTVRS
jgi:hypothetical protein